MRTAILLTLLLCACDDNTAPSIKPPIHYNIDAGMNIIKIRECEYVVWRSEYKGGIVHAGDCTNPIHTATP